MTGYLYTLNNDPDGNGVIVLRQNPDGSLAEVAGSPFPTGGKGVDVAAGDLDQQGAVRVHGEFVLAVNPGSDSVAVLRRGRGGRLSAVPGSPFPAGGPMPVSLTAHDDRVYVANQAAAFLNPAQPPNVTGFRLGADGGLTPIRGATLAFGAGEGPGQVELSPGGATLVVTAGFQFSDTNQIHAARVLPSGLLKPGPGSPARTKGVSGSVGFSWNPAGTRVFVSHFRGNVVAVFDVDPKTAAIRRVGGGHRTGGSAACWTVISADGGALYAANFLSNSVSAFLVRPDGGLKLLGTAGRRRAKDPDTKDLAISADGRFLYALGTFTRTISIFRIGEDRGLTELPAGGSPLRLKGGQGYLGLAG